MAETIRGLIEVVDVGGRSDCLRIRTTSLASLDGGLGPPDMCRLTKNSLSALPRGVEVEDTRFFHYVIGLDVVDAAHVSQYIAALVRAQEQEATQQQNWVSKFLTTSQRWAIRGGVYCCYDALHRVDVRVEVRIPGTPGVVAYALDAEGTPLSLDGGQNAHFWHGARLSAMLRTLVPPPRLPALLGLPMLSNNSSAKAFVALANQYFADGESLGPCPGVLSESHTLCELLFNFLIKSRRLAMATEACKSLDGKHPAVALHSARVTKKSGEDHVLMEQLCNELQTSSPDLGVLHYQAKVLLKKAGCEELALTAAHLAMQLSPTRWPFWITLSKALVNVQKYSAALAALNMLACVVQQEEPPPESGFPDFERCEQTKPREGAMQAGSLALRPFCCFEVLGSETGLDEFEGFGRGFGKLNPWLDDTVCESDETFVGEDSFVQELSSSPGLQLLEGSDAEREGYSVMVDLYNKVGWQGLLSLWSELFYLEEEDGGEEAKKDAQPSTAQSRETPIHAAHGLSTLYGKRECSWFMDNLFETLHSDLSLYAKVSKMTGIERTGKGIAFNGSGELWMYCGLLASRLQRHREMELSYRLCQARCACPAVSLSLLKCYISGDNAVVNDAVAQLSVLCQLVSLAGFGADPSLSPSLLGGAWPDWVFEAGARVVCTFGLQAAKAAASALPQSCEDHGPALDDLLEDLANAGVHGS